MPMQLHATSCNSIQAFWVPLSIGFCLPYYGNSMDVCSKADLFGGVVYTVNLIMSFEWGAVLAYDNQEVEIDDGLLLAEAYMKFGRFWIDLLATVPFVVLIVELVSNTNSSWHYIALISLVRLVRLVRLVSISKVRTKTGHNRIVMQGHQCGHMDGEVRLLHCLLTLHVEHPKQAFIHHPT